MPPRKRAGNAESAPTPDRPLYPPFEPDAFCPKCATDRVGCAYHAAGTRPSGDKIATAEGYPEWLMRTCRECGYYWVEMTADAVDPYAATIREAVRRSGALPRFGLPAGTVTYLDGSGNELDRWTDYLPERLNGVARWTEVETVLVHITDGDGTPHEIRVGSPWSKGAPATNGAAVPVATAPAPEQPQAGPAPEGGGQA